MDKQQHQCMRIQNFLSAILVATVDKAPPPWCPLGSLPLGSFPFGEPSAGWQALKLIFVGCQIYDQFHFEVHLIFASESSPQYEFFDLIGN